MINAKKGTSSELFSCIQPRHGDENKEDFLEKLSACLKESITMIGDYQSVLDTNTWVLE